MIYILDAALSALGFLICMLENEGHGTLYTTASNILFALSASPLR